MTELAYMIVSNFDTEKATSVDINERSPFIDVVQGGFEPIDQMESPRVFKTHLGLQFLPDQAPSKNKV